MLTELLTTLKDWIVQFHEHDSLLENKLEEELTEDERKAAWEEYEQEKERLCIPQRYHSADDRSTAQRIPTSQNMSDDIHGLHTSTFHGGREHFVHYRLIFL